MIDVRGTLRDVAYRTQHQSIRLAAIAFQRTARRLTRNDVAVDQSLIARLNHRYRQLLELDLENVRNGLYPASLLRLPWRQHLRALPPFLADVPRSYRRAMSGNFKDLPQHASAERYPSYYLRNFHWQTDGYFSRHSAQIYDLGVELLFGGTADVMRRQVIPPLAEHFHAQEIERPTILDIACGTGRTLAQLSESFPRAALRGIDLSPYYTNFASEVLPAAVALDSGNAEELPYSDASFDAVTCVYLFHELPKDARRRVLREALRVLKPGGLCVIEDSMQQSDSKDLAFFSGRFSQQFHEPYYRGYLSDPLERAAAECGFEVLSMEPHFVAKVVVAKRPLTSSSD